MLKFIIYLSFVLTLLAQSELKNNVLMAFTKQISTLNQIEASDRLIETAQLSPSSSIDLLLIYLKKFPDNMSNIIHTFKHLFPEKQKHMVKQLLVAYPERGMEIVNALLPKNCPFNKKNDEIHESVTEAQKNDAKEGSLACSSNSEITDLLVAIKQSGNNNLYQEAYYYINQNFPNSNNNNLVGSGNTGAETKPPTNDEVNAISKPPQPSPDGN